MTMYFDTAAEGWAFFKGAVENDSVGAAPDWVAELPRGLWAIEAHHVEEGDDRWASRYDVQYAKIKVRITGGGYEENNLILLKVGSVW